ncbi:fasciclin domain-containing protein [Parvularcula sp. ZS-1/3]|uniref:Fasciclin domain-containing protein n=1 Tax=Parvularcula mediterranea TaxID=2732508 RepID=A0A7Y3W6K6_9PROT|nr:fasciclin domain-containing protein [Parvularcula mediterranea]NNU17648.1 fasciclin domain-containing protein [Parvularcula mediterranea]
MKTLKALLLAAGALSLAPAAIAPAAALDHHGKKKMAKAEKTIVGVAAGVEDFATLVAAVKAADLVDTLNSDGPFTVFAPTNAGFESLPEGTVETLLKPENKSALQMVLTYHVVAGKVKAKDLVKLIRENDGEAVVTTVEGTELTARIKDGGVVLEDAAGGMINVVKTDIAASNGVIHVIDGVLLPAGNDGHDS